MAQLIENAGAKQILIVTFCHSLHFRPSQPTNPSRRPMETKLEDSPQLAATWRVIYRRDQLQIHGRRSVENMQGRNLRTILATAAVMALFLAATCAEPLPAQTRQSSSPAADARQNANPNQ